MGKPNIFLSQFFFIYIYIFTNMEVISFLRRLRLLTGSLGFVILGFVHIHGMFLTFELVTDSKFEVSEEAKLAAWKNRIDRCSSDFQGRTFESENEAFKFLEECAAQKRKEDKIFWGGIAVAIDLAFGALFFFGLYLGKLFVYEFREKNA